MQGLAESSRLQSVSHDEVTPPHGPHCADKFMAKDEAKSMGVFGAVNVGDHACWWDYGLLRLYRKNNRLLTEVKAHVVRCKILVVA